MYCRPAIHTPDMLSSIVCLRTSIFSCQVYDSPGNMLDINFRAGKLSKRVRAWARFIDPTLYGRNELIDAIVVHGELVQNIGTEDNPNWVASRTETGADVVQAAIVYGDASISRSIPVSVLVVWDDPGRSQQQLSRGLTRAINSINSLQPTVIKR